MVQPSWLEKIRGYIDLGMLDEASREIESLPIDRRSSSFAQEMRIIIELDKGRLNEALALSEVLTDLHPKNHAGFIQGAYCLHAMNRTEEAIEHLQAGPSSLQDESVYFYNLGCYELALGKPQAALSWLQQSFEMDPRSKNRALNDPDLEGIRTLIAGFEP
tara:strand:- start:2478 stop:2960 length:483 start_codon:yes stop_codon:yes gene_type:complete